MKSDLLYRFGIACFLSSFFVGILVTIAFFVWRDVVFTQSVKVWLDGLFIPIGWMLTLLCAVPIYQLTFRIRSEDLTPLFWLLFLGILMVILMGLILIPIVFSWR